MWFCLFAWLVGCFCLFSALIMRGKSHIWLEIQDWHFGGKEREAENGFQPKGPAAVPCSELKPEPSSA